MTLYLVYYKDDEVIGAIEFKPQFNKNGQLCKWHSDLLNQAINEDFSMYPGATHCAIHSSNIKHDAKGDITIIRGEG